MSRTAKRPRGGNSTKGSTHMGLLGTSLTMPASPDLMNFGFSSVALPICIKIKIVYLGIRQKKIIKKYDSERCGLIVSNIFQKQNWNCVSSVQERNYEYGQV